MRRHQVMEHGGDPPQFVFKVVSYHRTALNRQIKEAVRIRRRGGMGRILNSKAEFNRCHIPRLMVEEEDEESKKLREDREKKEDEELVRVLEDMDLAWEERKSKEMEMADRKRRRPRDQEEGDKLVGGKKKRLKRMEYKLLEDDWGEGCDVDDRDEDDSKDMDRSTPLYPPTGGLFVEPRSSSKSLTSSIIPDYFKKTPKTHRRMGDNARMTTVEDHGDEDLLCYWGTEEEEAELWNQHLEVAKKTPLSLETPGGQRCTWEEQWDSEDDIWMSQVKEDDLRESEKEDEDRDGFWKDPLSYVDRGEYKDPTPTGSVLQASAWLEDKGEDPSLSSTTPVRGFLELSGTEESTVPSNTTAELY